MNRTKYKKLMKDFQKFSGHYPKRTIWDREKGVRVSHATHSTSKYQRTSDSRVVWLSVVKETSERRRLKKAIKELKKGKGKK
jgi:hypothetical protein